MPYITEERRHIFDHYIDRILPELKGVGELNYCITKLIDGYVRQFVGKDGVNYAGHNAMLGVLEAVKQEYYRRRVSKYEDKKRDEHGEVYD